MKIKNISDYFIEFDDKSMITFSHEQDCCEFNYADFRSLDDLAMTYDFKEPIMFEAIPNAGFRFGNKGKMVFVPCYSSQNGYYSTDITIIYNGTPVLDFNCKEDFD